MKQFIFICLLLLSGLCGQFASAATPSPIPPSCLTTSGREFQGQEKPTHTKETKPFGKNDFEDSIKTFITALICLGLGVGILLLASGTLWAILGLAFAIVGFVWLLFGIAILFQ